MKVRLLVVGKTQGREFQSLLDEYTKRLSFYIDFDIVHIIQNTANLSEDQQKKQESLAILKKIEKKDTLLLLDETGNQYTSVAFSKVLENYMVQGASRLVFVIGGAFGFSKDLTDVAHAKIALSKMTFTHQMARLIFLEQLYRAFTIIKNESYHHN